MAKIIPKEHMRAQVYARDWRGAIAAAGQILVDAGSVMPQYINAMIRTVEDMGPYMVVAPGLAIVHAAPGLAVKKTDLALLTLSQPIYFGCGNDPVTLVLCFSAVDSQAHLQCLAAAASVLEQPEMIRKLSQAASAEELELLFHDA